MMEPGKSTCNKCGSSQRYKGEAGLLFCKSCDEWLAPECFPDRPIPALSDAEARIKELEALVTASEKDRYCTNFKLLKRAEAAEALLKEAAEALKGLEYACEQLAATRTMKIYDAMIEDGQTEALLALDGRLRAARAIHHKIGVKDE